MAKTYPWGGFKDGRIPVALLTTVRGELFEREAAEHLVQLEAAFQQKFGYQAIILQGYRPLGQPSDMAPAQPTQWGYYNLYRKTDPLRASTPGTSPHGYARSADFASGVDQYGSQQKDWMNQNAPAFGWHPTGDGFPRKEAWHFDYIPGTATALNPAALVPFQEEDDDMKLIAIRNYEPDGSIGIIDSGGYLHPISDLGLWNCYLRLGIVQQWPDGSFWLQQTDGTVWNALTARTAQAGAALADVRNAVLRPVLRDGKNVEQIQDNAETNTMVRALLARSSVTAEQIAAALVPLLPMSSAGLSEAQAVAAFKEAQSGLTLKATS